MENRRCSTDGVDDVAKDAPRDGIQEHNFAEEFSSDLPSVAMSSSALSGSSSPYASLQDKVPSAAKVDDRDVVAQHGGSAVSDLKKLEHALPSDPMQLPAGFGMVDSMGRPPVGYASNYDVAPGAFPVRSARNTATSRTFRSPMTLRDSPREFATEESKQEEGVTTSAAAGIGLYAVEAQRVPDGNDDGMVMVAEAEHLTPLKWYQRRWITLGSILCACAFAVVVVVVVVLLVRQPSAASSSSSSTSTTTVPITGAPATPDPTTVPSTTASPITGAPITPDPTAVPPTPKPISTAPPTRAPTAPAPPTPKPTSVLTPVGVACNFLSIPDVTMCRSTFVFDSYNGGDAANGDKTNGSSIPSEVGLLTQLTHLSFYNNSLITSIPSEIGLLTRLTYLSFYDNSLTSTIPSEIGLLTQLTWLSFYSNQFTSSIPSEIGLLTQLTWLDFESNALTSSIPSEIGLLKQLTLLDFSSNSLTGTIPSSLCSLSSLRGNIYIDCVEITCASGCCVDYGETDGSTSSCG